MRLAVSVGAAALAAAMGSAPLQCGGGRTDDPSLRMEDTAGDALWDLAQRFDGEHDDAAAKETLRYLVEKYPSNRHAREAREKLGLPAK